MSKALHINELLACFMCIESVDTVRVKLPPEHVAHD